MIASGGFGQIFASTSNPPAVTGDGMAIALRAGLSLRDVEFVQFHPTVMWRGPDAVGQQALVSEAVRGEGAILYDAAGERVMAGVHPLEDLAPRDVVAAAISRRMAEAPAGVDDHVFLDATHMGERFYERFPSITEACREIGIDPAVDRIPVAPAEHYACGGIPAGPRRCHRAPRVLRGGRGHVHGRPRREPPGVEQPHRVGRVRNAGGPRSGVGTSGRRSIPTCGADEPVGQPLLDPARRSARSAPSCHATSASSATPRRSPRPPEPWVRSPATCRRRSPPSRRSWEGTNLLTVAAAVVAAAQARTESRGCHRRTDIPIPTPRG